MPNQNKEPEALDLMRNNMPVCPYCGHENCSEKFSFVFDDKYESQVCDECGCEFESMMIVEVSYTTRKIEVNDAETNK